MHGLFDHLDREEDEDGRPASSSFSCWGLSIHIYNGANRGFKVVVHICTYLTMGCGRKSGACIYMISGRAEKVVVQRAPPSLAPLHIYDDVHARLR